MGTPEFSVGILDSIVKRGFDVAAVITVADKPAGRGQQIRISAVKQYALDNNLQILQPTNLKDPEFLESVRLLNANVQVVVAFRMLPRALWEMPEYGTFNLHASLLPDYRGAAPINWAIINGDTKTGVTTFFIDDKIDTGEIIHQMQTHIGPEESAGQLHDRLMQLGSEAVIHTLDMIAAGPVQTTPQTENSGNRPANKLNKENCKLDFSNSVEVLANMVRGLSPYPAAWCEVTDNGKDYQVKIYDARPVSESHDNPPGSIRVEGKTLRIAATDGWLEIGHLQFPGKKKMSARELLNGMSFSESAIAR